MHNRDISLAIVGAGVAGTALLGQLVQRHITPRKIICLDPRGAGNSDGFSLGPADAITNTNNGLNSLTDDNHNFSQWLVRNGLAVKKVNIDGCFTLRRNFLRYVKEMNRHFSDWLRAQGSTVTQLRQPVVEIRRSACAINLQLAEDTCLTCDIVFVATGTKATNHSLGSCCHNIIGLPDKSNPKVRIYGSKLSAIDAALYLSKICPAIRIQMVSFSGELPSVRDNTLLTHRLLKKTKPQLNRILESPAPGTAVKKYLVRTLEKSYGGTYSDIRRRLRSSYDGRQDAARSLRMDLEAAERRLNRWDHELAALVDDLNYLWWFMPPRGRLELKAAIRRLVSRYIGGFPIKNARQILELMDRHYLEVVAIRDIDPEEPFDLILNASGRSARLPPIKGFDPTEVITTPSFPLAYLTPFSTPLSQYRRLVIVLGGASEGEVYISNYVRGCLNQAKHAAQYLIETD